MMPSHTSCYEVVIEGVTREARVFVGDSDS